MLIASSSDSQIKNQHQQRFDIGGTDVKKTSIDNWNFCRAAVYFMRHQSRPVSGGIHVGHKSGKILRNRQA
jgi:hypothetical protein